MEYRQKATQLPRQKQILMLLLVNNGCLSQIVASKKCSKNTQFYDPKSFKTVIKILKLYQIIRMEPVWKTHMISLPLGPGYFGMH